MQKRKEFRLLCLFEKLTCELPKMCFVNSSMVGLLRQHAFRRGAPSPSSNHGALASEFLHYIFARPEFTYMRIVRCGFRLALLPTPSPASDSGPTAPKTPHPVIIVANTCSRP
jgi:hypothetical protein